MRNFVLGTIVAVLATGFGISLVNRSDPASEILAHCAKDSDRAVCYEITVPELYPKYSVPQIFDIVRQIRAQDTSYQFCHVLAHQLAIRVVATDPAAWRAAIALNPDNMCSNGFMHGVIIGRFNRAALTDEEIVQTIPDFSTACEGDSRHPMTPFAAATCYHGLGHLYTFITNANIPKALSLCAETAVHTRWDDTAICRAGVFMQIFQPLEPDDVALLRHLKSVPNASNYRAWCGQFPGAANQGACLREAWPLLRTGIRSGDGIATFCAKQPNTIETSLCYESALSIISRLTLSDEAAGQAACSRVEEKVRGECYAYLARAVIEEDRTNSSSAIARCSATEVIYKSQCFEMLASYARYVYDDTTRGAFCAQLPSAYRAQCER